MGNDTEVTPLRSDGHGPQVFTGEEVFDLIVEFKLGNLQQRNLITEFERFLSTRFFAGAEIGLIPKLKEKLLYIKEGIHHDRRIDQLGDGVQQLIILTLPLFLFREEPIAVFVEEPELYLHPGQQRALLEAWIARSTAKTQIFASTHSQQFLDMTVAVDRVSIYRFARYAEVGNNSNPVNATFDIRRWSNDDLTLLDELGVRNSSVLLVNATIWVEGITDRLYLRRFIDLAQQDVSEAEKIREDVHYSFVEYGGAAITHWSFLQKDGGSPTINVKRLCADVFLVADRPAKETPAFQNRHTALTTALPDRYHRWESLEIENVLRPRVLRATLRTLTKPAYELSESVKQSDYAGKRLGTYIRATLSDRPMPGIFDKDDVLSDKTKFCHEALRHLTKTSDLSDEVLALVGRIIGFVQERNRSAAEQA
jgi:hypothetical protein